MKSHNIYKSLQAGRAIAAILVVLFHLGGAIASEKYFGFKEFSIPFLFGSAGVDFFFVLSGFITLNSHRYDLFKPSKLGSYLKKRIIRIYPTYWIVFLSVFLLAILSPSLRDSMPHTIGTLSRSLLIIPQDKNIIGGTGSPVIVAAWTLQYEMFFYLCFASLILSRWLSIVLGFTFLYLYTVNIGASDLPFPLSFLLQDYTLLFVMGMLVSIACRSNKIVIKQPIFYAIFGAIIFALLSLDTVLQLDAIASKTLLYGLASSAIIFGLVKAEDKGYIVGGSSWLQSLGNASYCLYLIHYPLISVLCKLSLSMQLDKFGIVGTLISFVSIFCACLLAALAFHWWIEKPVAAYFRNRTLKANPSQS